MTLEQVVSKMMTVHEDDLSDQQSRDLIALHLAGMGVNVPPGALFLGLSDLQRPEVTVWSVWEGLRIAGIGALKLLDANAPGLYRARCRCPHPDNHHRFREGPRNTAVIA